LGAQLLESVEVILEKVEEPVKKEVSKEDIDIIN
jgi:hypothetical protein